MYRYRVTLEAPTAEGASDVLSFQATCHDDISAIVRRAPVRLGLDEEESKAVIVSLKLLSEVVLKHRSQDPFAQLRPALREFMLALKQDVRPENSQR